jgi:hypothetical protein
VLAVPALLLVGGFNAINAVALSNITILASAIANLLFNAPRRSPLRPGPLIDWDLVLLFGPPTVAGSIAGSYVNMVIPSWWVWGWGRRVKAPRVVRPGVRRAAQPVSGGLRPPLDAVAPGHSTAAPGPAARATRAPAAG